MSSRSNYDANRDRDYDADGKHHGKWTASGESRDLNNSTGVSSSSRLGRGDRYDSDRRRDSDFDRDFDRDYDRDYDRSDRYGSGMRGSRGLSGYNSGYGDSYGSSGYGSAYPSHLGGLGSSSYGSSSYGGFPHHLAGSSYPSNHYNSPYQLGSGLGSSGFGSSYPSHLGGLGSSGYGSSYPSHLGGLGSSSYGSPYHGSYLGDSYSYGSGHPGFGGLSHPGQFGGLSHPGQFGGFSHPGQYGSYDRDYRGSSSRGLGGFGNNNRHPVDVYEVGNDYIIELDLPGHSRDHIETKLAGNELLILSKPPKRDHQFHLNERSLGHREINRKLYLPPNADSQKINAALTNGVLRITIPKNAALAQSTGVVGTTPTAVIIPAVQQQAPHLTTVTTDTVTTTTDTKRI